MFWAAVLSLNVTHPAYANSTVSRMCTHVPCQASVRCFTTFIPFTLYCTVFTAYFHTGTTNCRKVFALCSHTSIAFTSLLEAEKYTNHKWMDDGHPTYGDPLKAHWLIFKVLAKNVQISQTAAKHWYTCTNTNSGIGIVANTEYGIWISYRTRQNNAPTLPYDTASVLVLNTNKTASEHALLEAAEGPLWPNPLVARWCPISSRSFSP